MVFLAQFSKSMKKYHVNILLGYYFKIFGETLIQDFWSWYYFTHFFLQSTAFKFCLLYCFKIIHLLEELIFQKDKNMFFTRKWYIWHNLISYWGTTLKFWVRH
jgi:hypothetical protein